MSKIKELNQAGQSVWFDYIERSMVSSGELAEIVEEGITGVTSNPSIFQQAITGSEAYESDLQDLVAKTGDAKEIFEALAIADIQAAADVLRPIYDATDKSDGYVSMEVAPDLAHETEKTIAEARRLHAAIDRPNLMIKVPATKEGIEAIRQLTSEGISINVTLIFGLERYAAVKEAYMQGLEERVAKRKPVDDISSVASFFISRVDVNIDEQLEKLGDSASQLMGKVAIANAKLAYAQFQEKFGISSISERWEQLAAAGGQMQRPLWASTGTKNPDYSDVLYMDTLIGPHTVNTVPPKTLDAFRDHGTIAQTVDKDVDDAKSVMKELANLGISIDEATEVLEAEGVEKFADAYTQLLDAIEEKRTELVTAS